MRESGFYFMGEKKPLILLVDDNPQNLQLLAENIESNGYEAAVALSGIQALNFTGEQKPDLILLDIMMPDLNGFEVCRMLKEDNMTRDVPIIFLTAKNDYDDITKAFEVGAVDFIIKPFNLVELNARLKTHLELNASKEKLRKINEDLIEANRELVKANEIISQKNDALNEAMRKLEIAATTDPLTGLMNRRSIRERIEGEIVRYQRSQKPFSLAMCDIDHFKQINDAHGHECGDAILIAVTEVIRDVIRAQDLLSRWGGEEYLFLLPETGADGAVTLVEKVRNKIERNAFKYDQLTFSITVTIGVAEYELPQQIDDTIRFADKAMYEGKRKGRNCVVLNQN